MSNHNNNDGILKIALNLTGACMFSGIIIAGVYAITHETAIRKAEEMKTESMRELVKDADKFEALKGEKECFEARKDGKPIAYIIPSESKGYGGSLKVLVAITPDGKVRNFTIIESKETPGLGDKAGQEPFTSEVLGKNAEHLEVTKDPQNHTDVHAISGATITSRAVTSAVKHAVEKVNSYLKGNNNHA